MKQPLVEIIVHAYAEVIPDFAALLTCQLSSLALWPPERCQARITLCCTPTDRLTVHVAKAFDDLYTDQRLPVMVVARMYTKRELFRRGLGRNDAAKQSKADVVHFADCDYLYGPGCLDALAATALPECMAFPRTVYIHRDHATGDAEIARVKAGEVFQPNLALFTPSTPKVAIGGIQIVRGERARERGYCDGTKWVKPRTDDRPFPDFREDRAARRAYGGSTPVDLPGVYRCRHSKTSYQPAEAR